MKHRGRNIFLAILAILVLLIGFLVLTVVAMCLTTCFAHYVRQIVFAMNDEAEPQSGDDEEEGAAAGAWRQGSAAGGLDERAAVQGSAAAGLDKAAIDRLPIVVYEMKAAGNEERRDAGAGAGAGAGELECGVCLADFDEKERVRLLPWCQHCFHPDCIDTWLSSHSTCPLCRRSPPLPCAIIDLGSPTSIART